MRPCTPKKNRNQTGTGKTSKERTPHRPTRLSTSCPADTHRRGPSMLTGPGRWTAARVHTAAPAAVPAGGPGTAGTACWRSPAFGSISAGFCRQIDVGRFLATRVLQVGGELIRGEHINFEKGTHVRRRRSDDAACVARRI